MKEDDAEEDDAEEDDAEEDDAENWGNGQEEGTRPAGSAPLLSFYF